MGVAIVGLLVVIGGALGLRGGSHRPPRPSPSPTPVAAPPSTVVERPPVRPSREAQATTTPKPSVVYYKNCGVALAEGAAPILSGEPGYRSGLDPDGDGVACPV